MNLSGITPLGYRVLVKPDPIETTTDAGIVIPDTEAEKYNRASHTGTLVAVGEFAWEDSKAKWAAIGDRVLFGKYNGREVIGEDGEIYRLLNDVDIHAGVSETYKVSELYGRQSY